MISSSKFVFAKKPKSHFFSLQNKKRVTVLFHKQGRILQQTKFSSFDDFRLNILVHYILFVLQVSAVVRGREAFSRKQCNSGPICPYGFCTLRKQHKYDVAFSVSFFLLRVVKETVNILYT